MNRSMDEKPVFDKADLMDRIDNDHLLAAELAELFITDVKVKLASLQAAIDNGIGSKIEKEAHSIKGAASNLSGQKVRHLAGSIETAGKYNDMKTVKAVMTELVPAIDAFIDALYSQIIEAAPK